MRSFAEDADVHLSWRLVVVRSTIDELFGGIDVGSWFCCADVEMSTTFAAFDRHCCAVRVSHGERGEEWGSEGRTNENRRNPALVSNNIRILSTLP